MRRRQLLVAGAAGCLAGPLAAQLPPPMPGARPIVLGGSVPADDPALTALLARAEAALRDGDAAQAQADYEQAVARRHAVDIEIGWLRAQLQAGEYRRALAFAAHVAGAHPDAAAGAALYAWLLARGAQPVVARAQLAAARRRWPGHDALAWVERRLAGDATLHDGPGPLRLGPWPTGAAPAPGARVVATALRVGPQRVLAPARMPGEEPARCWLRDGLGRTREARVLPDAAPPGLAWLDAGPWDDAPLPYRAAPRDAFAGSPAFALGYERGAAEAAWPAMAAGLIGRASDGVGRLGVELHASGGGPVLDHAGRLVGIALPGADGQAEGLAPVSALGRGVDVEVDERPAAQVARLAPDALYEIGMRVTLQVIAQA